VKGFRFQATAKKLRARFMARRALRVFKDWESRLGMIRRDLQTMFATESRDWIFGC